MVLRSSGSGTFPVTHLPFPISENMTGFGDVERMHHRIIGGKGACTTGKWLVELIDQHRFTNRIAGANIEEPTAIRRDVRRAALGQNGDPAWLASSKRKEQERKSRRL